MLALFQHKFVTLYSLPSLSSDGLLYHQPLLSGYINPRGLVAAQLRLAGSTGRLTHARSRLTGMARAADGLFQLDTSDGDIFRARKVLVANGAYANFTPGLKVQLAGVDRSKSFVKKWWSLGRLFLAKLQF